jgi:plasmid stabilization system protein ParE
VAASNVVVAFSPAARADLRRAVSRYEQEREGLGAIFQAAVRHAIEAKIAPAPHRWPVRHGKHRYVMRRFPYTVAYLTDSARVSIVAIAHQKRDPDSWEDR